ncbi:metallophosphoesterase [Alteraurantiacibacter aestuarii]|uniref:Serine/threonine protein phosphatase n=2 Tax=Alteraurantiacibacter aestuarii TaxID=650004 RepID=A0A844ZPA2_9SPHN|nr:metallophosphoesterase family protein [Alteraurantiacibacter aestuarii]MXO88850.1 serine/threonine protein phosphatase [Alteraurantiacibacter aestuarii]
MLQFIKSLLSGKEDADLPALPMGQRVYAIGDIHGRLDLFEALIAAVEEDDALAPTADTTVILLGDLVDRGPDSAGVVRRARAWQAQRNVRILCGNHEEMFLRSFDNADMMRHFMRHGGRETVQSYGVDRKALGAGSVEEAQAMMVQAVPSQELAYIASFEDMIQLGDYVFVHAGIDPEVPLAEQRPQDLRWIREPFLSHSEPYGTVVVHGHTISDQPEDKGNRIGIDTGAYASGRLTALVLEGSRRRYLEAAMSEDGTIKAGPRAVPA